MSRPVEAPALPVAVRAAGRGAVLGPDARSPVGGRSPPILLGRLNRARAGPPQQQQQPAPAPASAAAVAQAQAAAQAQAQAQVQAAAYAQAQAAAAAAQSTAVRRLAARASWRAAVGGPSGSPRTPALTPSATPSTALPSTALLGARTPSSGSTPQTVGFCLPPDVAGLPGSSPVARSPTLALPLGARHGQAASQPEARSPFAGGSPPAGSPKGACFFPAAGPEGGDCFFVAYQSPPVICLNGSAKTLPTAASVQSPVASPVARLASHGGS